MSHSVEEMLQQATEAMRKAYNPYSKFSVGVCFLGDDDQLYAGCNVENVSYSCTLCAESVALGKLISAGAKQIKEVVLISSGDLIISPCGACRQRLREFAKSDVKVHMYKLNGEHETHTIAELLPHSFSPEHLD